MIERLVKNARNGIDSALNMWIVRKTEEKGMTASVLNALPSVATVSDSSGGLNNAPRMATGEGFSTSFLQQIKGLQVQSPNYTVW